MVTVFVEVLMTAEPLAELALVRVSEGGISAAHDQGDGGGVAIIGHPVR